MDKRLLVEQFDTLIKSFDDEVDEIIYHYTSARGLQEIIEKSELHLSNVAFLNDKTECDLLHQVLENVEFTNLHVKGYASNYSGAFSKDSTHIISFTTKRDSLEQYLAYGRYCVGFKSKNLIKFPFRLSKCLYLPESVKTWLVKKEKDPNWNGSLLKDKKDWKDYAAYILLATAGRKFKNKHFENENEVRLIGISSPKIIYENSPQMYEKQPPIHYRWSPRYEIPIPYVKFFIEENSTLQEDKDTGSNTIQEMKRKRLLREQEKTRELLPIAEIILGPGQHEVEAKSAFEILLNDKGYKGVVVTLSDIPYR